MDKNGKKSVNIKVINEQILDKKKTDNFTKYGNIFVILGELLIIVQGIIYFSQFVLREGQLIPIGLGFVIFIPLLPIPAYIFVELLNFIAVKKDSRILRGISYSLLLAISSVSLLIGGGWYFGMVYNMVGVLLRIAAIEREKVR